MMQVLL